jgi:hypothetical protein
MCVIRGNPHEYMLLWISSVRSHSHSYEENLAVCSEPLSGPILCLWGHGSDLAFGFVSALALSAGGGLLSWQATPKATVLSVLKNTSATLACVCFIMFDFCC